MKDLLLTSGNPAKRIVLFALPLLAGEVLHLFYTMTDAYIVGRWLGINGLAAVGVSASLVQFVFSFIIGLTSGFIVITTQRVGEGSEDGIRRSVATGLLLSLSVAVVMTVALPLLSRPVLTVMRTPTEIIDDSTSYALIIFSGAAVFMFYFMVSGIIQAGGDSFTPMLFSLVGVVLNIVLDLLFVAVFSWGVGGAAAATVISELIACTLCAVFLFRRFRRYLPLRSDWRVGRAEFGTHLSMGIAMALQRSIVEVGNLLVQTVVNGLGALTVAAVTAAQRVRGLNMMPLFTLPRAVTTFTAQNYGAGKMDRVYSGLFQSCLISLGLGVIMAVLNQFIGTPIVSLFLRDSPEAVALARQYILVTGYTVFILGIMLDFRGALQGLGMKTASILCGVMETVMSVFAAFVLIPRIGFIGVCLVNPLSWLASGIPLYIAFGIYRKRLAGKSGE
ncbi:MAG: MATE family efflux transporter [Treponema sp.]|nr:MATE family efflux transporter [Treponema sp.]